MRRKVLVRSVRRLLRADEEIIDVAFMWSRHRLMIPYVLASFVALTAVAVAVGFDSWASRAGLGVGGSAVAAMATTNYRVLAQTSRGFVLMRASRVRQYAVEITERLKSPIEMTPQTSYMVATDWLVEDLRYTVPKSSEQSMVRMAAAE